VTGYKKANRSSELVAQTEYKN